MKSAFGIVAAMAAVSLMCASAYGQWVNMPTAGIPRGSDGKPNLSAATPRLSDGHPDLSGIWVASDARYTTNVATDLKPDDVPFQPWAKALVAQRADGSHSGEDPYTNCLPSGVP